LATATYTAIASITLGSSASSVEFSSIDQSYGDLILIVDGKSSSVFQNIVLTLNGSTSGFSHLNMRGGGGGTASSTGSTNVLGVTMDTTQGQVKMQFLDYSATDKHKTFLAMSTQADVRQLAGRFASTSALTSIKLEINSDTFAAGTTLALYGIAS